MSSAIPPEEIDMVVRNIHVLLNRHLVSILKSEHLPHSGVKASMQARLISWVEDTAGEGNVERFRRLKAHIYNPDTAGSPSHAKTGTFPYNTTTTASYPHSGAVARAVNSYNGMAPSTARPTFRDSPFHTVVQSLTPHEECPACPTQRSSKTLICIFSPEILSRMRTDGTLRAFVFCAADTGLGPFAKVEVSFPHQVELRVNNHEIKANLRGLKNKPGSTRPPDITPNLHVIEKYHNTVSMSYALTHKRYHFMVNLVRKHTVGDLLNKLSTGKLISKDRVIHEMVSRAQDADIVATSTIMSLKCPLSTLRMELPCRSTVCSHNQCFDGSSFLQLQEQAPTWTCPICNKYISFEALIVDDYVRDILRRTSRSTEQVTIEPDGAWRSSIEEQSSEPDPGVDTGDLIEVTNPRSSSLKNEPPVTPSYLQTTTPSAPRDTSSPSAQRSSSKRPPAAVVDLTLSDEDEPPRPAKRQMTTNHNFPRPHYPPPPPPPPPPHRMNGYSPTLPPPNGRGEGYNFTLPPTPHPNNPRLPSLPDLSYLSQRNGR